MLCARFRFSKGEEGGKGEGIGEGEGKGGVMLSTGTERNEIGGMVGWLFFSLLLEDKCNDVSVCADVDGSWLG